MTAVPHVVRRLGGAVLWATAVLGVVTVVLAVALPLVGLTPLVVRSGSMEPTIGVGSLALAREVPAADIERGDVVSVVRSDGARVTHRVRTAHHEGGSAVLALQGDANAAVDPEAYRVDSALRVVATVPRIGAWSARTASLPTLPVLALVAGGVLAVLAWRSRGAAPTGRHRGTRSRPSRLVTSGLLVATLAGGVVTGTPRPSWAAFQDTAAVTTGTVSAHTVASQAQPTCTSMPGIAGLLAYARITWTQVDARYEYAWSIVRLSTGATVQSGTVGSGTAAGSTITFDVTTGLTAVAGSYSFVLRARLASATTWTAATTTTTPVAQYALGARCGAS